MIAQSDTTPLTFCDWCQLIKVKPHGCKASPTFLLLCKSLSAQPYSVYHYVSFLCPTLNKTHFQSLNTLYVSKLCNFLLKVNFHAFYTLKGYFILLPVFNRFWEPNRHCALYMDSNICDSSVGPNWSQTPRLYCIHYSTTIPAAQALSHGPFTLL